MNEGGLESERSSETVSFDADKVDGPLVKAPSQKAKEVDLDQKLVKTASMTLEVSDDEDIPKTVKAIGDLARASKGYVANESRNVITIKVPNAALDAVLTRIKGLGDLTDQNVYVNDVTAQYVDIQIDNLKRLRTRLTELLVQGKTVTEVLEVEKELARVTRELEQLEGQMRLLNNQVGYATITTVVEESVSPGPIGWIFYGTYRAVKWLFVWD